MDPSNMLLEEVLGHAPLEKSETLQDIIFSIWDMHIFE